MSAIGLRVGSYEIVGRTQVPEPGDWHLARRTGASRRGPTEVLVRLLPPDASPDDREGLHHQYEVLRALDDPRVPDAVEFYEGLGAMAIEAVHGTPLDDVVRGRDGDVIAMSPSTLLDVLLELAETLQRAHHRNRHHGDLSPDRVLLAPDGRLWVFGFGRPLGAHPNQRWVAPEVRDGEASTAATDQWFIGVLGAALVGGGTPWTEAGADAIDRLLEPAERQWPALGRLLQRLMARSPSDRFPTMHPVRQELLALARKAGGGSGRRELGGDLARPRALDITTRAATPPTHTPPESDAPRDPDLPPDGFAPTHPGPSSSDVPELPDELPEADIEPELTISEEFDQPPARRPVEPLLGPDPVTAEGRTPAPAPRAAIQNDAFVVVRPEVGTDVPVAEVHEQGAVIPDAPPAPIDDGLSDLAPRGLGAPLPTGEVAADTAQDAALVAGVSYEPSDPDVPPPSPAPSPPSTPPDSDMHPVPSSAFPSTPHADGPAADSPVDPNPFATDLQEELAADAARAPGTGEGKTWDDLAREFATDPGANETILPPASDPSPALDGDTEPSAETEMGEPLASVLAKAKAATEGPGSDTSLGIGTLDNEDGPNATHTRPPSSSSPVPTDTLVRKVAPIAVIGFVSLLVLWALVQLFG